MQSVLSEPQFHSEEAAFAYVEARLWPNGLGLSSLQRNEADWPNEGPNDAPRPLQVLRLPQAIYGSHGHRVRIQPRSNADLAGKPFT